MALNEHTNKTMASACACQSSRFGAAWCHGYHTADARWTQRDTDRQLADTEASRKLSEEYRIKEHKLNETIGEIETRAINDAANAEMEYQAVMDRLRNAGANAADGLRVKPTLACRAVPNNSPHLQQWQ